MRLWSIHPRYLDRKGLVALWRESLLAQKALLGKTKGYANHPQLIRFKGNEDPVSAIGSYLVQILREGKRRGYRFDGGRISRPNDAVGILRVGSGQLAYEFEHMKRKVAVRDPAHLEKTGAVKMIEANPVFDVVDGGIGSWERVK